jgi:hypothetical protein
MRGYADGKIFLLHTEEQIPMVAFLFYKEAARIMEELKNAGIDCHIKETPCYGIEVQTVFILMWGKDPRDLILAYTSLKDAKNMCRILSANNPLYRISAVSCFDVMRNQTIGKYKLKFANNVHVMHTLNLMDGTQMATNLRD